MTVRSSTASSPCARSRRCGRSRYTPTTTPPPKAPAMKQPQRHRPTERRRHLPAPVSAAREFGLHLQFRMSWFIFDTSGWLPLSARVEGKPWDDSLYEDVPEHPVFPLGTRVTEAFLDSRTTVRVMTQFRIPSKSDHLLRGSWLDSRRVFSWILSNCMLNTFRKRIFARFLLSG